MNYGLQLYSVRDSMEKDVNATLKAVAEMGYKQVEFAGFFGHSAEDIKAMLDHYGLVCCSTHTGCNEIFDHLEDTVKYHKIIGNKNLIIPSGWIDTKEHLDHFIDGINRVQPILEAEGIALHFHNHSGEFMANQDGQIPHTELEKRTHILFQLDTFWVFNAGLDPVATIERLKHRVKTIHLKDGIPAAKSEDNRAHGKSVGSGEAPVLAVRKKAIELGLNIVIESEGLQPTGLEEVKRCIDFLKDQDAKDGN